ncbi:aldo-keto reductase family 1 member B1 [Stomoxys calcitrans]|uniref:NADP-dependent oxidoreductase domain-containing protein n=1 Tax=Stomoxys calcitrans TaxID=35570 RepID=A0A1I8NTV3_STOCA|nr:aldo-keto reductase family 1 member B1 [Stomoxys calcitrans]
MSLVSSQNVPCVVLNNGRQMPMIGLGTWRLQRKASEVVRDAIEVGYRHFDCAHIYRNEQGVGEAFNECMEKGVIKREDIFVTSKLWNTFHHPSMVRQALYTTLDNLNLDYLDNYLIHWPMAYRDGEDLYPKDAYGFLAFSQIDYIDTWKSMETLVEEGLIHSIGLSNFNIAQIKRILNVADIPPANLQIECHPYLNQKELMQFCKEHNIAVTAYSPLGSPSSPYKKPGEFPILQNPTILQLASKSGKTPAQILIRYQLQRGNVVIPRSSGKQHMEENLKVYDFTLSDEDMQVLDGMDFGGRFMLMIDATGHPHHPFENKAEFR